MSGATWLLAALAHARLAGRFSVPRPVGLPGAPALRVVCPDDERTAQRQSLIRSVTIYERGYHVPPIMRIHVRVIARISRAFVYPGSLIFSISATWSVCGAYTR